MLKHNLLDRSTGALAWLRQMWRAKSGAPSVSSLAIPTRKLTPIDEVVANVGREPLPPD